MTQQQAGTETKSRVSKENMKSVNNALHYQEPAYLLPACTIVRLVYTSVIYKLTMVHAGSRYSYDDGMAKILI